MSELLSEIPDQMLNPYYRMSQIGRSIDVRNLTVPVSDRTYAQIERIQKDKKVFEEQGYLPGYTSG